MSTKRVKRVGVWNFYEEITRDGFLFKNPEASIGAGLLKPWVDLYQHGQANGIEFVTLDQVRDLSEIDAVAFMDRPRAHPLIDQLMQTNIVKYLMIYESEVIKPDNWDLEYHQQFDRIFTWSDNHVDGRRYVKMNFAIDADSPFDFDALKRDFGQRKLASIVAGAKGSQHPFELYSDRVRAIRWFEANAPQDFDLYGGGWDAEQFPSYRGRVDDKLAVMSRYKFAICYENAKLIPGYITEKILDCFRAGTVPVYGGAPNITRWIPQDCFIDMGQFQTYDQLYSHLAGMDGARHAQYMDRIHAYLYGPEVYPFSSRCFVTTVTSFLDFDIGARHGEQPAGSIIAQDLASMQVNVTRPAPSLLESTERAFALAAQGKLELVELIESATTLGAGGHADIAISLYQAWLAATSSPLAYAVRFNLGVMLSDARDDAAAEAAYRAAIAQKPDFIEAHMNLGTLLERMGREDEALDMWRAIPAFCNMEAASDRALYVQAMNNLGRLLEIRKELGEAEEMLARSLKQDPKQPNAIAHWVHLRQKQCKWPVLDASLDIPHEDLMNGMSALAMLGASDDPARQLATARRYVAEKVLKDATPLAERRSYGHQRLRIGYLSSDFCSHAVSILTAELYGLHDRSQVEVFGFCWSREDGSPLRARVVAGMDHHIRIGSLSDEEAARLIRSHEIDILVDLHGLTQGTRHNILAHRPAPVQLTWLGFPGPTALPGIDYVIADEFVLPPELEPCFTEKPLHMPRCFQINDRERLVSAAPTREACGLPQDAFVFCSFNNNFKFTPEVFAGWMRILKRVDNGVLWLVADNETVRDNLRIEAAKHGVDSSRLYFAGRVPPADYLARYKAADLFLDTYPFGAGTTASDALWAGLPLLTWAGPVFASRMAGSLLRAVDLPELVTFSLEEYEEKAVALANDRARIEAMKRHLQENRLQTTLFDTPAFVRNLEALYRRVVDALPQPQERAIPDLSYLKPPQSDPEERRYVIVAPPYQHNSAGIRVLYDLQKWLVLAGLDAIVVTWFQGYPVEQFADDIVIYPEVAPGNLLGAKRVIRWILNVPGKLGYGEPTYDPGETLVAYNDQLAHYANGVMLQVPSIEPFFHAEGALKTVDAVFVGKGRDLGMHPPGCVEITKQFPATRRDMARLLRSVKTLWIYDDFSMVAREAALCGCDVRLLREDGAHDYPKHSWPTLDEFKVQLHAFIEMSKRL